MAIAAPNDLRQDHRDNGRFGHAPLRGRWLAEYFTSGWLFLCPYLLVYLGYEFWHGPVNPFPGAPAKWFVVPSLLQAFRILHLLHIGLALYALYRWYRLKAEESHAEPRQPSPGPMAFVGEVLPWCLLFLLFYIPSLYLEWPSDTWEHFRRISEWSSQNYVGDHSAGYKAFYFIPYSLIGAAHPEAWPWKLSLYYSFVCLLLAWQYHRLGSAVGLSRPASLLFVLVTVMTAGNACFSFYRYYGLSTTVFAQLSAVAGLRIVVQALGNPNPNAQFSWYSSLRTRFTARTAAALAALGVLIGFSHLQGFLIAGLGAASAVGWRVTAHRPVRLALIALCLGIASLGAIYWFPRSAEIDLRLVSSGWLNSWRGFNLFSLSSPAFARAWMILGAFGVVNLAAGVVLVLNRNLVGWLTLGPIVALALPLFAVPFGASLMHSGETEILAFHRVLFAIPSGLALVKLLDGFSRQMGSHSEKPGWLAVHRVSFHFGLMIAAIGFVVVVPNDSWGYNRAWNAFARVPDDLAMKPTWRSIVALSERPNPAASDLIVTTTAPGFMLSMQHTGQDMARGRLYWRIEGGPAHDAAYAELFLEPSRLRPTTVVFLPEPTAFYSPRSIGGALSGHWLEQEAVLTTAGTRELRFLSVDCGLKEHALQAAHFYCLETVDRR